MSILTLFLKQDITHWSLSGVDGFNEETFATPVVLKARWEDRASKVLNPEGTEIISNSRIYLAKDVKVGDYLFNGVTTTADPKSVLGACLVLNFRKVPDLFANDFERRAFL